MPDQIVQAIKFVGGQSEQTFETLTYEAALQININNRAFTITMRSPGNDTLLACGLLFTEGIINSYQDIISITENQSPNTDDILSVDVIVSEKILSGKNLFNRSIASSASCGICGKTEILDITETTPFLNNNSRLDINTLNDFFMKMRLQQHTFGLTGGSHAAAIFASTELLMAVNEDIGRHNAVDKVIGECLINNTLPKAMVLCVSGRVSYEIATKCYKAGIPFLASVSAPSSLSVEYCQKIGITLIAFCRGDKATVYTHRERISQLSPTILNRMNT